MFLCSFIKNKAFALILGVAGIGIISQLSNFIGFLNYLIPLGIPSGLSKFVSEKELSQKEELKKIFFNSIYLVFFPTLAFSIICFFFSSSISYFLFDNYDYSKYIVIISFFIPFVVLNSILEGFLRGLNIINVYVKVNIYSNIISLLIIIPLVLLLDLYGSVIGILSVYFVYVIISSYYLQKTGIFERTKIKFKFDKELVSKILKVSFVFLISGAIFQFTLLLIRKTIISEFGLFYNGIYQSTISISLNYFGFIYLSLSSYSFPTISKLNSDSEVNNELNINVRYIILLMVPLILGIYNFRYIVISILYSSEFYESQKLYLFQFLGDFFKALSWAIGIWLVPKLKLKYFLIIEVILNINLIVLFHTLIYLFPKYFEAISLSYLITYIIHFILNYWVTKKTIGFKFTQINNRLLKLSIMFFIPLLTISYFNIYIGYIIFIPSLILWLKLSTDKSELMQLKEYITSKLKS